MYPLPPIALTGQSQQVILPTINTGQGLYLENASSIDLTVSWGPMAPHNLSAGSSKLIRVDEDSGSLGNVLNVTPVSVNPWVGSTVSQNLLLTIYNPNEHPDIIPVQFNLSRVPLGSITIGQNSAGSKNFVLPHGTLGIGYMPLGIRTAPSSVQITGHNSNNPYTNFNNPGLTFREVLIDPTVDASVDCTINTGAGLGASVIFFAVLSTDSVFVRNDALEAIPVQGSPSGAALLVDVSDRLVRQLGRVVLVDDSNAVLPGLTGAGPKTVPVQEGANPPLWQSPNKPVKPFNISLAAVGVQNIIAGVAGQNIYLFDINGDFNQTAAGAGTWQDTVPNLIDGVNASAIGGPRPRHWSGAKLPTGAGLDFNVANAVANLIYQGGIGYSQG